MLRKRHYNNVFFQAGHLSLSFVVESNVGCDLMLSADSIIGSLSIVNVAVSCE